MGRRSVRKGKDWERHCARLLTEAGFPSERVLSEPRDGNVGDLDVQGAPLVVQCRVGAQPSVWRAVTDAEDAAGLDTLPVALVRRNGSGGRPPEDLAVLPLPAFLALLAMLSLGQEGSG